MTTVSFLFKPATQEFTNDIRNLVSHIGYKWDDSTVTLAAQSIQGVSVYPMAAGGSQEAWLMTFLEAVNENKDRKDGALEMSIQALQQIYLGCKIEDIQ